MELVRDISPKVRRFHESVRVALLPTKSSLTATGPQGSACLLCFFASLGTRGICGSSAVSTPQAAAVPS